MDLLKSLTHFLCINSLFALSELELEMRAPNQNLGQPEETMLLDQL